MEKKFDKKQSNRAFFWTLLFIAITVALIIAFYFFYMRGIRQTASKKEFSGYYVMITDDRKSSFYQAVYAGAAKRGQESDIYVDLFGDNFPSDYTKTDLMKMAISSKVDGIIVEADESETMTELINQAYGEGIPVVTLINDNTQSNRCSFVGVGGYNIGREYGKQIKEIYLEKLKEDPSKSVSSNSIQVAVLNSTNQTSGQNVIISGLQETLETEMGSDTSVEVSLVSVDNSNAFSVEESVRDLFINQKLPDVIVALDELTTTCVYQAVVDYNEVGNVRILGYYNSDTINNAINRGAIYSTILVDTAQLGGYCVDALKEYNEMGATSQYFTADIELINRSNVAQYMKKGEPDDE